MSTESAKSTTNSTKPGTNYDLQQRSTPILMWHQEWGLNTQWLWDLEMWRVIRFPERLTSMVDGHQIHPSWLESFWRERPWKASGHSSKVQVLLSVQDLHDMNGHESFSNSGYSVIGVRPPDTKATCGEPDLNWLHCHSVRQTRFVHFCPLLIHSS